jgi:hypothetical protein
MSIPVFRNGTWIHYEIPETGTSIWTNSLKFKAASVYATAITKGFSKEKSLVLTECCINKLLYGVTYTKQIEEEIKSLYV